MKVVTFSVGEEVYGLEIHEVQEIIVPESVTRVPNLPDFMEGIVDVRGTPIPVVDMRKRFETPDLKNTGRILIAQISGSSLGLRVDAVGKVIAVARDQTRPAPKMLSSLGARFIGSVCGRPPEAGGGIVMLVNLEKILGEDEMTAFRLSAESARVEESSAANSPVLAERKQILEFVVGKQRFAVDINSVSEAVPYVAPTPLIHTPFWVMGIINLRGRITALLDTAGFFGMERDDITSKTRVLVIQSRGESGLEDAGFLVDEVTGSRCIDASRIFDPPVIVQGVQRECMLGVLEEDAGPLVLLGPDRIFASEKITAL